MFLKQSLSFFSYKHLCRKLAFRNAESRMKKTTSLISLIERFLLASLSSPGEMKPSLFLQQKIKRQ